jgi:hypothetical protein
MVAVSNIWAGRLALLCWSDGPLCLIVNSLFLVEGIFPTDEATISPYFSHQLSAALTKCFVG